MDGRLKTTTKRHRAIFLRYNSATTPCMQMYEPSGNDERNHRRYGRSRKRVSQGHHLVQDAANRPHIARLCIWLALANLRGEI